MAFVVSHGEVRGLARPTTSVPRSLQITPGYTSDYAAIWRTHGSVRTVTDFLARNIASLGLHLFERAGDADRRRVTDHPLAQLIGRPMPGQYRYAFVEALVQDIAIFDRYLAVKMKGTDSDAPHALVRIPPMIWEPAGDDWTGPTEFLVRGNRGTRTFTRDQVVYIGGYSPAGELGGVPAIESLRSVLAEEHEAALMRAQTFRNGARASGYLERPAGAPPWSAATHARFKAAWRAQYTGSGADVGGTPILEDGMKFTAAQQSAKDLQYIESRKLTRQEVAAAYHIPPPMIGLMETATFASLKEQHKSLYTDTLGPWLQRIQQALAANLLDDFGPEAASMYLEFNIEEKLRGAFEDQAAQLQTSTGAPWLTRNEARAMRNLPAVEGGDELVVPLNVLTGGQASPTDSGTQNQRAGHTPRVKAVGPIEYELKAPAGDTIPAEETDPLAAVFRSHFKRQRAAITSATGAKSPTWWDGKRWDAELAEDLLDAGSDLATTAARDVLTGMGLDPDQYDTPRTEAFLAKVAERIASQVNAATLRQIEAALADDEDDEDDDVDPVGHVFDVAEESRADQAAMTAAATFVGFGMAEAPRQVAPKATKRWVVNSSNPRASHAALDGEEVGIEEDFSNGMPWPGSFTGDPEDVANCQCSLVIIR
ncbi:phage portal protein [Micrococcus yunnanensis]|uniref:phage portal protein n=1 Tax=Micrococcus yunnanensis TaxID=566027 RepID=UPI00300E529E